MADCCCPEPRLNDGSAGCGECGTAGRPVAAVTVKVMLTVSALRRYEHHVYRLCPDPRCAVVYFGEDGSVFTTSDVRERIWQKEPPGRRTVCYCFGENESDIAAEIERRGYSEAVQRVRTHIAAGRCACEIRNPRGACCLGDVIAAVERLSGVKVPG
jgi:Zinc binding domain